MSQENLKFDNDDEDGTQGNEMTVGVMNARFGDMGVDDEGGNALTQYNGRTGFSQVGDNSANGDDSDKTQSEQSNEMEEERITALKDAPIANAAIFKKYLLWSSKYKVMSAEERQEEQTF